MRFQTNDYSVPVAYGYHQVWVRGYVEQVVIGCGTEVIARHRRSYEREDTVFDPLHYLPLIERKLGALDQAAPLAGWELPDAFATLRRLMEARSGRAGRREYVQVLRLLETFGLDDVHAAVKHALRLGAIGFDAVKHLVLCRVEKGSVRNSVFGPPWPDPVGPTVLGHCSSLARVCRAQSTGGVRSSPPQWCTERFPRAVHGRGPLSRPSAGGQAVEIAGHDSSTTNRSPKRIASSGRTWCQNSGGARHFRCTPRSAK